MKQTLLSVIFSLFAVVAFSHNGQPDSGVSAFPPASHFAEQNPISIYPNPATNFISIDNDENVKQIAVFNLVGRRLLTFEEVEAGTRYDVSSLPSGMYLVRIIDQSNKIMTTQRISKR